MIKYIKISHISKPVFLFTKFTFITRKVRVLKNIIVKKQKIEKTIKDTGMLIEFTGQQPLVFYFINFFLIRDISKPKENKQK